MTELMKIQKILDDPEALRTLEVDGEWKADIEEIYARLYGDGDAGLDDDPYHWNASMREQDRTKIGGRR
jgi:hypothetical protein